LFKATIRTSQLVPFQINADTFIRISLRNFRMTQEWTFSDSDEARRRGWAVEYVLEKVDGRNTPFLAIRSLLALPTEEIVDIVKKRAERGDPLSIKAITLIAKFRLENS
jgi:hypothetical protein